MPIKFLLKKSCDEQEGCCYSCRAAGRKIRTEEQSQHADAIVMGQPFKIAIKSSSVSHPLRLLFLLLLNFEHYLRQQSPK